MHNKNHISFTTTLQFSNSLLDAVFFSIIQSIDPYYIIKNSCSLDANIFSVIDVQGNSHSYGVSPYKDIVMIGIGKACAHLAVYCKEIFSDKISQALLVVKHGYQIKLEGLTYIVSGHPVPNENSIIAAEKVANIVENADRDTMILFLITGGGSSLLELPKPGITLTDLRRFTELILHAGLSIQEINTLRTAISEIKGGRLGAIAEPANVVSLILSDVPGNDIKIIASGPTVLPKTRSGSALDILSHHHLLEHTPGNILNVLKTEEDIFNGKTYSSHIHNHIIGSNRTVLKNIYDIAESRQYNTRIITDSLSGTIDDNVSAFEKILANLPYEKICLISGGEAEVNVTSKNPIGGRNTHFALVFAYEFYFKFTERNIHFVSFATDGTDGTTDSAGAALSMKHIRSTVTRQDIDKHVKNFTSYSFFMDIGGLIKTGPTMSNFMDIQVLIAD